MDEINPIFQVSNFYETFQPLVMIISEEFLRFDSIRAEWSFTKFDPGRLF